jgi:PAS domain S-box-containing protein
MEQEIKYTIPSYLISKPIALFSVITLGITISIFAFISANNLEKEKTKIKFDKVASGHILQIKERINDALLQLDSLASFYQASYEVERSEFNKFVTHSLEHFPAIQALQWIPRVPHSKRSHIEETAQREGFPNFHITEMIEQGVMIKAGERDEYFPVYFTEPYAGNENALGFDLGSSQARFEALIKSRDTGEKVSTSGIKLVQEKAEQIGLLIFNPIYSKGVALDSIEARRRNLEGFVLGVFRIGDLIERSLEGIEPVGVDIYLYDSARSANKKLLYFHSSRLRTVKGFRELTESEVRKDLNLAGAIPVADKTWKIVCAITPDFYALERTWQPFGILAAGILITCLLSGYVLLIFVQMEKTRRNAAETLRAKEVLEHEITERKEVEAALRESEEKYQKLFNNEIDAVSIFDLETRKILDVNEAYVKLYGYSREEVLQLTTDDISAESEKTKSAIKKSSATGSMLIPLRRHRKKDGTVFSVEISAGPFTWKGRKVMYAVARDITERIQLDNERLKSQKLESVTMLAGGIAHDFNNLLTGIFGNVSLAKMHSEAGSKTHQFLEETEKALERTKNLTQQLLTFSKGGAPVKKTLLLSPVIKESVKFALSGSNVKSEISIAEDLKPVEADEGQISQVLHNLIINADHAMPEGGLLRVRAENMTVGARDISPFNEGDYVAISIEDTGFGIPEEYLSRIFDPFFTSKHKGSGLGLTTAYSIISKHHGLINVKSTLEKGTTFYIYLPVSENKLSERKYDDDSLLAGEGRILLMDDEETVLQVCSEMLRAINYKVDLVTKGEEAIDKYTKALESGSYYDAVILDLTVPGGMGGKETIRMLIEIDPELKAIVSSGYADDPILSEYGNYGFRAALSKPYNIKELSKALYEVLKQS